MPRIYFDAKEQGCSSYSGPTIVLKLLYENKRALGGVGPAALMVEVEAVVACWLAAFNRCSMLRITGIDWVGGGLGVTGVPA